MSDPYLGEVRLFAGNFAPLGWALCQGQLVAIFEYEALFSLIGTTYGGDGQNTFALPDLRGRVPLHQGTGPGLSTRQIGERAGTEQVTLTASQMPSHNHVVGATSAAAGSATGSTGKVLAGTSINVYGNGPASVPMAGAAITPSGGAQPHDNMAPFLGMNYIISLFGIFPSRS